MLVHSHTVLFSTHSAEVPFNGWPTYAVDGMAVGNSDGDMDGDPVGDDVGVAVGEIVGASVGEIVGDMDGVIVGDDVGASVHPEQVSSQFLMYWELNELSSLQ